jgi:hypothetical protein
MEPRSRGMNGLSTILCLVEVRVIPHTFMLPRHSLSDHVVEALTLQLIRTVGSPPGEEKHTLPLSPGRKLLLKGLGDLSRTWYLYVKHINILYVQISVRIPIKRYIDYNSYPLAAFFKS